MCNYVIDWLILAGMFPETLPHFLHLVSSAWLDSVEFSFVYFSSLSYFLQQTVGSWNNAWNYSKHFWEHAPISWKQEGLVRFSDPFKSFHPRFDLRVKDRRVFTGSCGVSHIAGLCHPSTSQILTLSKNLQPFKSRTNPLQLRSDSGPQFQPNPKLIHIHSKWNWWDWLPVNLKSAASESRFGQIEEMQTTF